MEKLNKTGDVYLYLKQGKMTKPFMRDEEVFKKVQSDQMVNTKRSEIESLMAYIKHHLKPSEDENFKNKNKFRRTASQIWKSGVATGCADNALVFATMARQIGIPTTILETADKSFLEEFAKDSSVKAYRGHFFCECFYHEKWVLVDPTFNKVMEDFAKEYRASDPGAFVPENVEKTPVWSRGTSESTEVTPLSSLRSAMGLENKQ